MDSLSFRLDYLEDFHTHPHNKDGLVKRTLYRGLIIIINRDTETNTYSVQVELPREHPNYFNPRNLFEDGYTMTCPKISGHNDVIDFIIRVDGKSRRFVGYDYSHAGDYWPRVNNVRDNPSDVTHTYAMVLADAYRTVDSIINVLTTRVENDDIIKIFMSYLFKLNHRIS